MPPRAYRLSGGTRHPLRDGFTAYAVLSPATNSSCHRRRRILRPINPVGLECVTADLAPATGVRTTRFCRTLKRRSSCAPARRSRVQPALRHPWRADALASTTSRPAFVTTRDRPSCRERTGRAGSADLPDGESEIFFEIGLDRSLVICPSGQLSRLLAHTSLRAKRSNRQGRVFAS